VDEQLNAAQARDHIEMVARILEESQQRLCAGGEFFVVWGLFGAFVTLLGHFVASRALPSQALWAGLVALIAAIAFSIRRGRILRVESERGSLLQREFFNVLWITIGMGFVANLAVFNIFRGIASAAIWNFADAIVLFYIGMHGNRRAQVAGIAVVVSLVVANFTSGDVGAYVLAAGVFAGYCGFGVAELLSRD
jgi:hypothetical protein